MEVQWEWKAKWHQTICSGFEMLPGRARRTAAMASSVDILAAQISAQTATVPDRPFPPLQCTTTFFPYKHPIK